MSTTATALPAAYRPSGRVGWQAPLKVAVYGGFGAAVLAAVYALVIRYNPFIYFSFLATLGFGALLGSMAGSAADAGFSRSRAFNAFAGLALGVFGLWLHWLVWTWLMFDDGAATARHLATSGPAGWLDFLADTADHRQVSIGRLGSSGAQESPGFMMTTWALEALAMLALSTLAATLAPRPFSEKAMKWATPDWEGDIPLAGADADAALDATQLAQRLDREGLDWLDALRVQALRAGNPTPYVRLKLTCLGVAEDPACAYVTLRKVTPRGEKKTTTDDVVTNRHGEATAYARLVKALRTAVVSPNDPQGPAAWK